MMTCSTCEKTATRDCSHEFCNFRDYFHATPKDECDHNFTGWITFSDGRGGTTVCSKCGMDAMSHTLRTS